MLKKLLAIGVLLAAIGGGVFWILTAPGGVEAAALPARQPDVVNGERVFNAGGCASCHAVPKATGEDKLKLAGGLELDTPFGIFRVPNISSDPQTGIGGWSTLDFVNAMQHGVSPEGAHYYPAFPYGSYARMRTEDVVDLKAYLDRLPAVTNEVAGHSLPFPFNVRRGLGLWKILYLDEAPAIALPADASEEVRRGQYLVEALGHCGECHTPRDVLGGPDKANWLAGALNPEGKGTIPNITPHDDGIGGWSSDDVVYSLESGFKPDFDTFGGSMVAVQETMAKLPPEDRAAIAAYLKAVPARPNAVSKPSS